jgi:hypothetical protein
MESLLNMCWVRFEYECPANPVKQCFWFQRSAWSVLYILPGNSHLTWSLPCTGNDQDEYGFERGTRKIYELDIGSELGTLQRVRVQQV